MFENFTLHDCMGLEPTDGEGFHVSDVISMIKGNIKQNYQFNPRSEIKETDDAFEKAPKAEDRIHCVLFIIDATSLKGDLPKGTIRKIWELQNKISELNVPRILIITKIDLLCDEVNADIKKTFWSIKVRDVVDKAHGIFKIPQSNIHPIKNYESEGDVNCEVDLLLMYPFLQGLGFAEKFLKNLGNKRSKGLSVSSRR